MAGKSITFSHAIVCRPSASCIDGLRAIDVGAPELDIFKTHHQHYIDSLQATGAHVQILDEAPAFPDSVFVEDTALCLNEGAIIMKPGAPTRLGEAQLMKPVLENIYSNVVSINGPGSIEGGDILTTEREILVGLSARTDMSGVSELSDLVSDWGYKVRIVNTPPDILHFKTDCSLLAENTVLATPKLAETGCFEGYEVVLTAPDESACANAIRFNDVIIMPDGFPETFEKLVALGYQVKCVGNTEAAKLDGGMSCLSLRFTPS